MDLLERHGLPSPSRSTCSTVEVRRPVRTPAVLLAGCVGLRIPAWILPLRHLRPRRPAPGASAGGTERCHHATALRGTRVQQPRRLPSFPPTPRASSHDEAHSPGTCSFFGPSRGEVPVAPLTSAFARVVSARLAPARSASLRSVPVRSAAARSACNEPLRAGVPGGNEES